ncbi:MAG: type IV pilus biogenesis/stability protein PilW [Endozoicomonas sp.]
MTVLLSVALAGCVSSGGGQPEVDDAQVVESYLNLAKGYVQEGYTEKALKPLKRALEVQPRSAEAHSVLGLVYQVQGETSLAEQAFRKALSYEPDSGEINNNFGAFLFSQNRLDEAYRLFSRAAQDVNYESRSRTYENLGIVTLRQDKRQQAEGHFEKALRLNGNLPLARLELSSLLFEQGRKRDAWRNYQVFASLSRQNERSLTLGVRLARANGDHSAAANYALQLERLYPGARKP